MELAAFSHRLAEIGYAIYQLEYHFFEFGSWSMECGRRHHRALLQWDGKESLVSLSQCVVADSRDPRDWNLITEKNVSDRSRLFGVAEALLMENIGR